MELSFLKVYERVRPFLVVILMQLGNAGMAVIAKFALNHGMSHYTLVVYRHAFATLVISPFALALERKVRPRMTTSTLMKILLLGLLEPVIDQNLYYMGMKQTSATFTAAMCNVVPAITFLMAWICRMEKVKIRKLEGQAKVVGTVGAVGGAMLMTVIRGPVLHLPWSNTSTTLYHATATSPNLSTQNPIKGSLMITTGCVCWSCFIILQAMTLKSYPAELSLATWICAAGAVEGTILTLAVERGNTSIWSLSSHYRLLAVLYGGILMSGVGLFAQGALLKERGPVFVTAFNPLCMIFVAIMGSFLLAEQLYLGRVIGAIVIVVGLYLVVWGKSKDQPPPEPKGGDQQMVALDQQSTATIVRDSKTSNPDFVTVAVGNVVPTDEQV